MPINIDWLGDGWTYYSNEERKSMDTNEKKPQLPLPGIGVIDLPADQKKRYYLASAAAGSLGCFLMPLNLGRAMIDILTRTHGADEPNDEDCERFTEMARHMEVLVKEAERAETLNQMMHHPENN